MAPSTDAQKMLDLERRAVNKYEHDEAHSASTAADPTCTLPTKKVLNYSEDSQHPDHTHGMALSTDAQKMLDLERRAVNKYENDEAHSASTAADRTCTLPTKKVLNYSEDSQHPDHTQDAL